MFSFGESVISVLVCPLRGRNGSCRVMCREMLLFACFVVFSFVSISASVLRTPEFAEPIKNGTLQVGSDVEFSCDVRHLGTYRVAWSWKKHDDQKFLGIGIVKIVSDSRIHISRIQKSDDVTQFNLYIYNIKKEDAGTYHCSVNSNPMIEQIGTLDVVGDEHEYANGHNGKIVNGKSVAIPPKPVKKGIDSSSASLGTSAGESQQDGSGRSLPSSSSSSSTTTTPLSLDPTMNSGEPNNSNSTSSNNSESSSSSSIFCIDLSEIWENARERIANFLSSLMRFTYSYLFS